MSINFDLELEALVCSGEHELAQERKSRNLKDRLARLKEAHPDSWMEMVRVTVASRTPRRY
jgi:hypothetical protein